MRDSAAGIFGGRRSPSARDAMRAAAEAPGTEAQIDVVLLDIGCPTPPGRTRVGISGLRPAPDIIAITSERDLQMVRAAVDTGRSHIC